MKHTLASLSYITDILVCFFDRTNTNTFNDRHVQFLINLFSSPSRLFPGPQQKSSDVSHRDLFLSSHSRPERIIYFNHAFNSITKHGNSLGEETRSASERRIRTIGSNRKVTLLLFSRLRHRIVPWRFISVIKDEIRQAQGNEEYYFGNPINSYLFIKHLTSDWYNIEDILPAGCFNPTKKKKLLIGIFLLDISKALGDNWLFPSFEDYTGREVFFRAEVRLAPFRLCNWIDALTRYIPVEY